MPGRTGIERLTRLIAVVITAVVFAWSGLFKMLHPELFALALYRYQLLPGSWINLLALWIASTEFLCAVLLFVPRLRVAALWMVFCLLCVFSTVLVITLLRGISLSCGCFSASPLDEPIGWPMLLRNAGLIVLVVYALFHYRQVPSNPKNKVS